MSADAVFGPVYDGAQGPFSVSPLAGVTGIGGELPFPPAWQQSQGPTGSDGKLTFTSIPDLASVELSLYGPAGYAPATLKVWSNWDYGFVPSFARLFKTKPAPPTPTIPPFLRPPWTLTWTPPASGWTLYAKGVTDSQVTEASVNTGGSTSISVTSGSDEVEFLLLGPSSSDPALGWTWSYPTAEAAGVSPGLTIVNLGGISVGCTTALLGPLLRCRVSGKTGDCTCLPDTFLLGWDGSQWSSGSLSACGGAFAVALNCYAGQLWQLTGSVSQVSLLTQSSDPFSLVFHAHQVGVCSGEATFTITAF